LQRAYCSVQCSSISEEAFFQSLADPLGSDERAACLHNKLRIAAETMSDHLTYQFLKPTCRVEEGF
jgi:hypothetical protein